MSKEAPGLIPCRKAFTTTLTELARSDRRIIAITTDARGSVTLDEFARELPAQFVEVGIAEQDAVGIAAGLAACGKKPFVCGPACFLTTRSLDQVKVDVAYSNTNVKIVGVSGGVSYGALGSSHHALHDVAVLRAIPGIAVILPCDARQTRALTRFLAVCDFPVYVRLGRDAAADVYEEEAPFILGKANELLAGSALTIIGTGEMARIALDAGLLLRSMGVSARVLDMHTVKPLDENAVLRAAAETGGIITLEEHSIHGGLGAAVAEVLSQKHPTLLRILGIPDEPAIAGSQKQIWQHYGLTAENIVRTALEILPAAEAGRVRAKGAAQGWAI